MIDYMQFLIFFQPEKGVFLRCYVNQKIIVIFFRLSVEYLEKGKKLVCTLSFAFGNVAQETRQHFVQLTQNAVCRIL